MTTTLEATKAAEGRLDGESADLYIEGQLTPGSTPTGHVPVLVVRMVSAYAESTRLGSVALGIKDARALATALLSACDALALADAEDLVESAAIPFVHAYFHPDPNDCRTYAQCHARAYGPSEVKPARLSVWVHRDPYGSVALFSSEAAAEAYAESNGTHSAYPIHDEEVMD